MQQVKTPCIGICSTTSFGDTICRGCKRYAFEVIQWNGYNPQQKLAVLRRLEQFTEQIMQVKFAIVDEQKLRQGLHKLRVPFDESLSPFCWLHNLLSKSGDQVSKLIDFGVRTKAPFQQMSLLALSEQIEDELLKLGQAHFDRYFNQHDGRVEL